MKHPDAPLLYRWLKDHKAIFASREAGEEVEILELYSKKRRNIRAWELEKIEERKNSLNPLETYLILLFQNGRQLILSKQGFAFAPDFSNSGPLPLPNQVYCMQDFQNLYSRLRHTASESERGPESLQLILILIAILDGAKAVGLDLDEEAEEVNRVLSEIEKGEVLPPPH